MEEYFDIGHPDGSPTGRSAPRSEVHRQGLWHRSSHLWLTDGRGNLLLQRRHPSKETDPDRWDIAVAGHLSAGQTPLEAIVREAREELGLTLDPTALVFLGASPKEYLEKAFADREWQHLFAGTWEGDLGALDLQADEVTEVRWMPVEAYRQVLGDRSPSYVDRQADSEPVFAWLEKVCRGA